MSDAVDVTELLLAWNNGEKEALDKLIPKVYQELRKLAFGRLRNERAYHSLQATALVNEAYIKLINLKDVTWKNRIHFFGVAAQLMRNILVDYARNVQAQKRGGDRDRITLADVADLPEKKDVDLIALDDALKRLEAIDPQQSRIVELRYFGGLTIEETAQALEISPATVKREWNIARAWLHKRIVESN